MIRTLFIKLTTVVLLFAVLPRAHAQVSGTYVPDSARLFISSNTSVCIWSDTMRLKGSLYMADSSSRVYFKGVVWNSDTASVFSSGRLVMNGAAPQKIIGRGSYVNASPSFRALEINNPAGVSLLSSHIRVDSLLAFSRGVLYTGGNDVVLGPAITISQTDSSFVQPTDGGGVSRYVTGNGTIAFPTGIKSARALYSPLQLDVRASSYTASSFIRVSMTDSAHEMRSLRHVNYGAKYWSVMFNSLAVDSAIYVATYDRNESFRGDSSKITGTAYKDGDWYYTSSGRIPGQSLKVTGSINMNADIYGQDIDLIKANLKVYLQGPWTGATMRTNLRTNNLIPLSQPYGVSPFTLANFNYKGGDKKSSLPANAVDWVLVELRNTPTGAPVARSAGLLLNDGSIIDGFLNCPIEFQGVAPGNYYISVKHRNHLGVVSATTVSLPNVVTYDFTTAANKAYNNNMAALTGGVYGLLSGNVYPDPQIRGTGLSITNDGNRLLSLLGVSSGVVTNVYSSGDVNMDGILRASGIASINDYNRFMTFLGNTSNVLSQGF